MSFNSKNIFGILADKNLFSTTPCSRQTPTYITPAHSILFSNGRKEKTRTIQTG